MWCYCVNECNSLLYMFVSTIAFFAPFYIEVYFSPILLLLSTMDILQIIRSIVVVVCGRWLIGAILHLFIAYRILVVLVLWIRNIGNKTRLICFWFNVALCCFKIWYFNLRIFLIEVIMICFALHVVECFEKKLNGYRSDTLNSRIILLY